MIRPESDWLQNSHLIADFAAGPRFNLPGATLEIREFRWTRPAPGSIAPQRHYLDCSLTDDSRDSLVKSDGWKELQPSGRMLYLTPDRLYWGEPAKQKRRSICVMFDDDFIDRLFEGEEMSRQMRPGADVQSERLGRACQAMATELMSPGFATDLLLESLLIGAVVELARHSREGAGGGLDPFSFDRRTRRIAEFVEANLSSPLSITEIAKGCGISARHVTRVFKQGTRIGLAEYVTQRRLALAKRLLASENYPIKEISWRCGFRSNSAFSAAFRSATETTPRDFRRRAWAR